MNPSEKTQPAPPADILELARQARAVAAKAYNPYSRFSVGAVLRTRSGSLYSGCNIENASYSVTLCAERSAGAAAISAGDSNWDTLVVVSPTRVSMCGVCRQFCHEFAPQLSIWLGFLEDDSELLGPTPLELWLPGGMTLEQN